MPSEQSHWLSHMAITIIVGVMQVGGSHWDSDPAEAKLNWSGRVLVLRAYARSS